MENKNNYNAWQPMGAKILNSVTYNYSKIGLPSASLSPAFNPPNPMSLFNPADVNSPAGYIGNMGSNGQYIPISFLKDQGILKNNTKPATALKERFEQLIREDSNKNVSKPFDMNHFIKNFYKAVEKEFPINKEDDLNSVYSIPYTFSSIPRTSGILGTFVRPTSKISINSLYNASNDAILGSILNMARATIIGQFKEYRHKNKKFEKLMKYTINSLGGDKFWFRCCDFLIAGNGCGNKVWDTLKDGYHYVSDVVWAPYTDIQYQVDYFGKLMGAVQPSMFSPLQGIFEGYDSDCGESLFSVRELIPKIIPYILVPRDELFYIAYDNDFSPYGNSPIRRAYQFFLLKQAILDMYTTALYRNGSGVIIMYFDKNMMMNTEQINEMNQVIEEIRVGDSVTIPSQKGNGYELEMLQTNTGGIGTFQSALDYCDKMMKASLCPNDSMLNDANSSYSSNVVNKDSFKEMYSLYASVVRNAFREQIEEPMLKYNFPDEYQNDEYGYFISSAPSLADISEIIKQFEMGVNSQLIDPSNLDIVNHYMEKLDMPVYQNESDLPFIKNPDMMKKERLTNTREADSKPFSHNSNKSFKQEDYNANS